MAFTFLTNLSCSVFLTTSFFTASLSLLKSTGTATNLPTSKLSTLLFKLFNSVGTFSILSKFFSDFKIPKSVFSENFDVSTPVAFFKSGFVA